MFSIQTRKGVVVVAKGKKKSEKVSKIHKKLRVMLHQTTLHQVADNLGGEIHTRRFPGADLHQAFLFGVRIVKKSGQLSATSSSDWYGEGATPDEATRDLCKKLKGKVLCPQNGGPCCGGQPEMAILGKVFPPKKPKKEKK